MAETWRAIPNFEGFYEASDRGRIRSLPRTVHTLTPAGPRRRPVPGVVLALGVRKDGRYTVVLHREGKRVTRFVHQLVLETFVGPRPAGLEGCHNNGNCRDNRPENLRWDTRKNNAADMHRHGTVYQTKIENCPRGHRLAEPNLVEWHLRHGKRLCLACTKTHKRKSWAEKKGRPFDFQTVADLIYREITRASD